MPGYIAARRIAVLLFLLPPIFAGSAPACAQYQMNLGVVAQPQPPIQAGAPTEPFGLDVAPVTGGQVVAKWSGVVADIRSDSEILAHCRDDADSCPAPAQKFLAIIADGRAHAGRARVGVINRAVNLAIRPTSDLVQWGVPDRWSAPLVTLATGRGDCEDYAIAKYVALKAAGVAEDDLRLVIVRDLAVGADHAIVAVRLNGGWIMLDNRRLVLLQDVELRQVLPLFVVDDGGVKQFAPTLVAGADRATARTASPSWLDLPGASNE